MGADPRPLGVVKLGRLGIWSGELRFLRDRRAAVAAAVELEEMGYDAIWLPGGTGTGTPIFDVLDEILNATRSVVVASGIISIWVQDAAETAQGQLRLRAAHPDRFLLGLGVSHLRFLDEQARSLSSKPRSAMERYLDAVDAAAGEDLSAERILAALGPKMLQLARERSLGSHPYFVTPEHTARARDLLGPDALLAPEQAAVLQADPARAREIARAHMALYLELPNYVNNLMRAGRFTEEDFRDGGSDRLVDAVVAWGDEDAISARVQAHRDAGADHVSVQLLSGRRGELPLAEWRRLADALRD
jgi:probable F420-dependent oxidoreductase